MEKTAGIVCDDYKLKKFEKELEKNGFTEFSVSPFTHTTSTIKVKTVENRLPELHKLCKKVEHHFLTIKN